MDVANEVQVTSSQRIYVSYAWSAEKETALVDQLETACKQKGVELIRDNNTIQYGDSIGEYMQALGAGDGIIVILSDGYLKSHNCMFELLEIEKNRQFHQRVFPLKLQGLSINKAIDRLDYLRFWENEIAVFKEKLKGVDPTYTKGIAKELDLYNDIRRGIDGLMDILRDMYSPSETIHRETNFEALLNTLLKRLPGALSQDEVLSQFKSTVLNNIQTALDRKPLQSLKIVLMADVMSDHPAQWLCDENPEQVIDKLHRAVQACLEQLADQGARGKQDRVILWTGAMQILGWLVLLSVEDKWVLRNTKNVSPQDESITLEIPFLNNSSVEVVVARLTGLPAKFAIDTSNMDVSGKNCINMGLEMGTSATDVVQQVAVATWNKVYRVQETMISDGQIKQLNHTLGLRRKRNNDNHYISVLKSHQHHPVNRTDTYRSLCEKLSNLGIIFITSETDDDVLLVPSPNLSSLVTEFLLLDH